MADESGLLTKGRAVLLLNSDTSRQAIGSAHESVEASCEVNQGARNGAACLAGEQGVSLLIQGNLLQEGASALCQVGLAGTNGYGAIQVQVVNEAEAAAQKKS